MKTALYTPLVTIACLLMTYQSTKAQLLKTSKVVNEQTGYISGICVSPNDSLYAFSVASWRTLVLDHNFNTVRQFNYSAMWGGGGPSFSHDNQYVAFKTYGEMDTLMIYSLRTSDSVQYPMDVAAVQFLNTENKVLTMWNGYFSVYDVTTKSMTKEVLNVGQNDTKFTSRFYLTSNDSLLIASSSDFTLDVYTTSNWKLTESLFQANDEISNVTGDDNHVAFSVDNTVYVYDLKTQKEVASFTAPVKYIGELKLHGNALYVAGTEYNFVLKYDIKSGKTSKLAKLQHERKKSFSVQPLSDGRFLIGDYSHLRLYSK